MAVGGSPRETAKAISDGFLNLTVTNLRKFNTPDKLRTLLSSVTVLEREVRGEIIGDDDFEVARKKHFRLGNLRKARLVINGFIKSRRIKL